MKDSAKLSLLVLATTLAVLPYNASAAKAKPKPKAKPVQHVVQGTTQLKGEYADFGTTYTIGKSNPINITINSAEYSIEAAKVGEEHYVPSADEKVLVLHMTLHNPQKSERFVRWDVLSFTVVDPQDQNHDGLRAMGMEKDKSATNMSLKPAQKIDVFGVMLVPSNGEMPKLIVKSDDDLVLRYNLKGKVKGFQPPFADPADKTGSTPLSKISIPMGTYAPLGYFKVKVNSVEYSPESKIGEFEASEGNKIVIVQMDVNNVAPNERFLRWDTITGKIIDVDGMEVSDCRDMFTKSRDASVATNLQSGQELMTRCIYQVPDDAKIKDLTLLIDNGRTFVFDLSNVKQP